MLRTLLPLTLLLLLPSLVHAQRVRGPRRHGPATEAARRAHAPLGRGALVPAAFTSEAGQRRTTRERRDQRGHLALVTSEAGQRRTTRERRDQRGHLALVPGGAEIYGRSAPASAPAPASASADSGADPSSGRRRRAPHPTTATPREVVHGVRQTFRPGARDGFLRTTLTPEAMRAHPALATALRRFPDALVVGRLRGVFARGYELRGPNTHHAETGDPVYLRLEVTPAGQIHAQLRHVHTGRPVGPRRIVSRDWRRHPAIAEVPMPERLFVLSDVHGTPQTMRALLAQHHVVADDTLAPRWTAGRATVVFNGDLMNKGPHTLSTIDYVRELQRQAHAAGGRVIVTLGNHEAMFIARPLGGYSGHPVRGANAELVRHGSLPEDVALGRDAAGRGAWLRELPAAARVGDLLITHTGDTNGLTLRRLARRIQRAVDREGYRSRTFIGGFDDRDSLLQSAGWEQDDARSETPGPVRHDRIERNIRAAGVRGIVAGHNPGMLRHGQTGGISATADGRLTNTDSNIPTARHDDVPPAILLVERRAGRATAQELDLHGGRRELWSR